MEHNEYKRVTRRQAEQELTRRYLILHPVTPQDMIKLYVPPKWNPTEKWNPACNIILERICNAQK